MRRARARVRRLRRGDRRALNDRPGKPAIGATLADVADPAAIDRVFADVRATLGGLDVLVNNAGIAGPAGGVDEIDPGDWERTMSINLDAQYRFARQAVPMLRDSAHGGSIIALSSVAGRLGYAFRTPYAATKWAIVGLVKSLAIELGRPASASTRFSPASCAARA
ncbi:MAG: 3-beta-hydroxycholanate 3-dehydrogenase (NADP(+)) [Burkholderia gladioli]|nr:MAG: 3-beta-hydroxycholanate 3-dehydrogenase (NADP(+)) [Burkholderia gladioli]